MNQKEMLKQLITFNQTAFNNAVGTMASMQEQFEQVAKTVLEQANWLPAEGVRAIEDWVEAVKTGQNNFREYVDDSYQKVEKYFSE